MSGSPVGTSRVGPWELMGELGRGGMGIVWRVRHHQSGLMGALKARRVLRGESNWREIEALSRLDHPNIIAIHDQGLLPEGLSAGMRTARERDVENGGAHADEAELGAPAGAPYYVMALARESLGERLRAGAHPITWPELAAVLEGTLRALAHLHAHGLLHRDIKPDNVLVMGSGPLGVSQVRLADFGLAALADRSGGHGGTPRFMAPEQLQRRLGAIGPWTDLYQVGLLAWVMASGRLPNRHGSNAQVLLGLERLEPVLEVPSGFEAWSRRLLELAPERRPESAAEALAELLALGASAAGDAPPGQLADELVGEDATLDETREERPRVTPTVSVRALPSPSSSRVGHEESRPSGLGLVGRRVYPLVGRDAAMAALNVMVERAGHSEQVEQVERVVVTGPPGVGKSRLVEAFVAALAERRPLRIARLSDPDDAVGLLTGLLGLPRVLPPDEGLFEARLSEAPAWVLGAIRSGLGGRREATRGERDEGVDEVGAVVAAASWLIERSERLSLIVADLGLADGGPLIRRLQAPAGRVLVLMTAERQGQSPDMQTLPLGALSAEDTLFLTREVLALDEALAAAVVEVSEGHPATLVALLRALVERDVLVMGPHGWAMRARPRSWLLTALEADAPERERLVALGAERVLAERVLVALVLCGVQPKVEQLARVLGGEVEAVEGMLARLGALGLVTGLERVGLSRPALGAALLSEWSAQRSEEVTALRRAWVRALEVEGSLAEQARTLVALVRLHDELGLPIGELAQRAARLHLGRGAPGEALAVLESGVAGAARVSAETQVLRAEALILLGRHDEGLALLSAHRDRVDARWLEAQVARLSGRHLDALAAYGEVLAREGDAVARARVQVRRSMSLRELGRLDEARGELEAAGVLESSGPFDRVLFLRAKAQLFRALGRPEEQLAVARDAVALAEALGSPGDLGSALTELAGAANQLGRHEEAIAALRRGHHVARALGRADQAIDLLNLGLVHLSHGLDCEADAYLEEGIAALSKLGWDAPLSAAHALRLVSLGRLGRWEAWPHHLDEAERLLTLTGVRDPDVKRALWEAVALAEAARVEAERVDRVDRVDRLRALAEAQG